MRLRLLMTILLMTFLEGLYAGGGGGFYVIAPVPLPNLPMSSLNNSGTSDVNKSYDSFGNNLGISPTQMYGGYGYGLTPDDGILGFYGVALMPVINTGVVSKNHAMGFIFGTILGQRIVAGKNFHIDVGGRIGYGPLGLMGTKTKNGNTYTTGPNWGGVLHAEPYAELGIELIPFFRPCISVGFCSLGSLDADGVFTKFRYINPSVGVSLSFGNFN